MLIHGGRLNQAAQHYGRPREEWLDLSTGINPRGWPAPAIPADCWQRLPETGDGLETAAREYYQCPELLPVAGSQAAIQALPQLRPHCRVVVVSPGYAEHAEAWRRSGHQVEELQASAIDAVIDRVDVLVVINPNNPSSRFHPREQLLDWHRRLACRGGWLVIDEAFIDPTPELSLAPLSPLPGLVLLRSVGKFFGLAGIRCGFVAAEPALLSALENLLGPWTISGPARYVCREALLDGPWQRNTRLSLQQDSARLDRLLQHSFDEQIRGTALFRSLKTERAGDYYEYLARRGILIRLFPERQLLRFGLADCEQDWQRLEGALSGIRTDLLQPLS